MTHLITLQAELERSRRRRQWVQLLMLALVLVTVLGSVQVIIIEDTDWARVGTFGQIMESVGRFMALDWSLIPHLGIPMLETFLMACLGTILGLFFSLPVAWFGALNVTPSKRILYPFGRFLMTLSRSIHEMVWALIFVAAVGLGALPGILAIAMRSVGFISKITAEAIENIDPKPVEAIRAVGGNNFQVMTYGILPQIKTVVLGTIIFEWDINIRRSAIMGLVGAGGLGLTFFRQMAMYNYGGVTVVILAILSLILLGEILSHYTRKAIV
ncbi:phosphonate transport system permease protein [Marinobacterium halophilum]|uniref:Phosphonate transport system permease protein n=1 Tax=Marinobacterium halophilum TaxID=267374 RepID=A0A2P8F259_9GAMM|nr:phosphonate ABC transporter, permease protein PhnE [Marinobacterium halophilum]PSL15805.1 phosphonate transport system permease protein [Marinobacterium halophilum]